MNPINREDKVEFTARGVVYRGIVVGSSTSHRGDRMRKTMAQSMGLPDDYLKRSGTEVLEIWPSDNRGIWKIPASACTSLGRATQAEYDAARQAASDLRAHRSQVFRDRDDKNYQTVQAGGLDSLKKGDNVEIQFKGGVWRVLPFTRLSPSGRVGFMSHGREAFSHPQYARVPVGQHS